MNHHVPSRALAALAHGLPPETAAAEAEGWQVPADLVLACPSSSPQAAIAHRRRRQGVEPLATARVVVAGRRYLAWVYYPAPHGDLVLRLDVERARRLP
jgi:hypothetical protein